MPKKPTPKAQRKAKTDLAPSLPPANPSPFQRKAGPKAGTGGLVKIPQQMQQRVNGALKDKVDAQISMQPKQITPLLSLHAITGGHILRLYDSSKTQLALHLARGIASGTLIIVTPNDTKIFDLGSGELRDAAPQRLRPPQPTPASELGEDENEEAETPETQDQSVDDSSDADQGADPMERAMALAAADTSESVVRPRNRRSPAPSNTPNSACGRCSGTGTTMAGGSCPVCQGSGLIRRYGARPS